MSAFTTYDVDVDVESLTTKHLVWCLAEHLPAETLRSRRRCLRLLDDAGTATREEVEAVWASRRDLSPSTRANDLAGWRAFYKWALRWEHRVDDPTLRIDAPHVPRGLPRPMAKHDLRKALDTFPDDLRRAVCVGAYAGLRVSEAAALDWSEVLIAEIVGETSKIRVLGKGAKERLVAVSPILIDELLPDVGGNVITAGGQAYTAGTLQRRINRAFLRAGVPGKFHALRHRYGTVAYQATGDLVAVAEQMGHASVTTTAVYAAASSDVAAKIAAAVVR